MIRYMRNICHQEHNTTCVYTEYLVIHGDQVAVLGRGAKALPRSAFAGPLPVPRWITDNPPIIVDT